MSYFFWRDVVEVLFFSSLFYGISVWLKKDTQKNLLGYFYLYCLITLGAHHLQLTTIAFCLTIFSPVIFMLFIMLHQDILQRNFVALKNVLPAKKTRSHWLEQFIRTCLVAANNNKSLICVIENKDSMETLLDTTLKLHTDCSSGLLDILIQSESFDQNTLVWLNARGTIIGINATWKTELNRSLISEESQKLATWKQQALLHTDKTDALVMHIDAKTSMFDIIIASKLYEQVTATNALKSIRAYLYQKNNQGEMHVFSRKKGTHQQPRA